MLCALPAFGEDQDTSFTFTVTGNIISDTNTNVVGITSTNKCKFDNGKLLTDPLAQGNQTFEITCPANIEQITLDFQPKSGSEGELVLVEPRTITLNADDTQYTFEDVTFSETATTPATTTTSTEQDKIQCNERCLNNMHAKSAYYHAVYDRWYPTKCLAGYKAQYPITASDGTIYYKKCDIILDCPACDDACKKQLHATEIYCDTETARWKPVTCEDNYDTYGYYGLPTTGKGENGEDITYYDMCLSKNAPECEYQEITDTTLLEYDECSYLCYQESLKKECKFADAETIVDDTDQENEIACLCNATDEQIRKYKESLSTTQEEEDFPNLLQEVVVTADSAQTRIENLITQLANCIEHIETTAP